MNNLFQKLKNLSRKNKILISLVILILILVLLTSKKGDIENRIQNISPTPVNNLPVSDGMVEVKRVNADDVYQLNRFETLENILSYSWVENKLIYATKDGIFNLWQNEQIVNDDINEINFNSVGVASFYNQRGWHIFDPYSETVTDLSITGINLKINTSKTYALFINNGSLTISSLTDFSQKNIKIEEEKEVVFGWNEPENTVFLYNKTDSILGLYDVNTNLINKTSLAKNENFLAISPDGNYIATESENHQFNVRLFSNTENRLQTNFNGELKAYWMDNSNVLVIENTKREYLDLYDSYYWTINVSGALTFLANSYPIVNKVNLDTQIVLNKDKTALGLVENEGKLWVLALNPSVIPLYDINGILFTKVPYLKEHDHHIDDQGYSSPSTEGNNISF